MSRADDTGAGLPPAVLMAHRGYPGCYPENSLVGIRAALEAGAEMVEFDIQLTADGVPVVLHDDTLARTATREDCVFDLHSGALDGIDVCEPRRFGARFHDVPVPTLAATLALVDEYPHATAFVELKLESMARFGRAAVVDAAMRAVGRHPRRVVISYDAEMLSLARAAGAAHIGWVAPSLAVEHQREAVRLAPEYVLCAAAAVPAQGNPLWAGDWRWVVFDVNDPRQARALLSRGVDIVETDCIGELLA